MSDRVAKRSSKTTKAAKTKFDKYDLYRRAVQSPEDDVVFFRKVYKEIRGCRPTSMREDFCGTALLSCEWVKLDNHHEATGVDLDPEPLNYGRDHYATELTSHQRDRLKLIEGNVLAKGREPVDLTVAVNFSYFLFKSRAQLRDYFRRMHEGLGPGGLALIDCFGGSQCQGAIEDKTRHKGFTYFWDQEGYDPVSGEATFHIHFQVGKTKHRKVFTYDWRMWTIPELRELMAEAGFKKTHIYWEGTAKDGTGNGIFKRVNVGEECLSWIAYIVAEK